MKKASIPIAGKLAHIPIGVRLSGLLFMFAASHEFLAVLEVTEANVLLLLVLAILGMCSRG